MNRIKVLDRRVEDGSESRKEEVIDDDGEG